MNNSDFTLLNSPFTRLLMIFGFNALLPLAAVGWYNCDIARQMLLDTQVRVITGRADKLATHLDLLLAECQANIHQLAEDSMVKSLSATWPDASTEIQMGSQENLDNLVGPTPISAWHAC